MRDSHFLATESRLPWRAWVQSGSVLLLLLFSAVGAVGDDQLVETDPLEQSLSYQFGHDIHWPLRSSDSTPLLFPPAMGIPLPRDLEERPQADSIDSLPLRPPPSLDAPRTTPEFEIDAGQFDQPVCTPRQTPLGFAGKSGILPADLQQDSHFVPMPDRWRSGFPHWDRYGPETRVFPEGDPFEDDHPYARGDWWDPYRQNVLKGDYPIVGQNTFFNFTAMNMSTIEFHQVPTPTGPFESKSSS